MNRYKLIKGLFIHFDTGPAKATIDGEDFKIHFGTKLKVWKDRLTVEIEVGDLIEEAIKMIKREQA